MSEIVAKLEAAGINLEGITHFPAERSESFSVQGQPTPETLDAFTTLRTIADFLQNIGIDFRACNCKDDCGMKVMDRIIIDY